MTEDEIDALIRQLESNADADGKLSLALATKLRARGSIEPLRRLLSSESVQGVRAGAWILSELGAKAEELVDDVPKLLAFDSAYVRAFAIDALTSFADARHGVEVARTIELLDDPELAVRSKAMRLIAVAPVDTLVAARSYLPTALQAHVDWLTTLASAPNRSKDVIARLQSGDPMTRRFAVAAATRIADLTLDALRAASSSEDGEIRRFASLELSIRALSTPI